MSFINKILGKFLGNKSEKDIKTILPVVTEINIEFEKLKNLTNDELRQKSQELKEIIHNHIKGDNQLIFELREKAENDEIDFSDREEIYNQIDKLQKEIITKVKIILDDILPVAFAIVKETARRFKENESLEVTAQQFDKNLAASRNSIQIVGDKAVWYNKWLAGGNEITWDMIHYDVQLIGGIALHQGKIAEMATGEGKTLVATLPVFLNALSGRGVHIVTVNDYLAKRDAEWMGPLYEFHGLRVDCIDKHQPNSPDRRSAYAADITYGTNNEFGFDYLRDNMAISPEDLVQRGHNYTIVDEVDSVLIDDARTPLIISGPIPKGDKQLFEDLKSKVVKLYTEQKKLVTQILADAKKLISSGDNDKGGILLVRAFKGLPENSAIIKFLSEQGNKTLLQKTENIYLAENAKRMHEITDDLFFVIEEKQNSIELTDKGIELITGASDDPNFFILPDIGSEIADLEKSTLSEEEKIAIKDKLLAEHAIKSERVHTINQLLKAYAMFEIDVDYVVMDNKVKIVDEQTGRILEGRRYSDGLHQAIEAKENVKVEAATQTFATITLQNYFRMYTKIAGMTGTAETEAGEFWSIYKLDVVVIPTNVKAIRDDREDLIYKTRREKFNAVIKEIVALANAGRPVLVGTTSVEISELLSKMLSRQNIKHNVLNAKLHQREADIVAEAGKKSTVTIATNMAGRGTDIKLSKEVKEAGGLAIIGTERHDSRRVDRQLRGRAGRQGDPGSSQFFVSLEDDLMRMFGSDRIAKVMDFMKLQEGEVIQHSMITKSIERAQKKVEENNFGIRKRLLEYDDVMNSQREVVYRKRKNALFGERIDVEIANMIYEVSEGIVEKYYSDTDFDGFAYELVKTLSIESPYTRDRFIKINSEEIVEKINEKAIESFKRKTTVISDKVFPFIKDVFDRQSHQYEYILIPISDGTRIFNIRVNLAKAYETKGKEVIKAFEKTIMLVAIDEVWKEHLRELDDLKQAVQSASYEQKDPLLIYKMESFNLFTNLVDKYNKSVTSTLLKAHIPIQNSSQVRQAEAPKKLDLSGLKTQKDDFSGNTQKEKEVQKIQPVRTEKKVGRNEPCPCGSGKKYKHCHGAQESVDAK
jgi:preprotein translocase subunit SecA